MNEPETHNYEFGEFRVDAVKRLLTRGDGEIIPLTPKVFELLLCLVRNNGRTIEKDELMREIWADTIVEESNLSQNISILRRVLGEKRGEHQFIVTVPGRGYKFVAEVVESPKSQISNLESNIADEIKPGVVLKDSEAGQERLVTRDLRLETTEDRRPKPKDLRFRCGNFIDCRRRMVLSAARFERIRVNFAGQNRRRAAV